MRSILGFAGHGYASAPAELRAAQAMLWSLALASFLLAGARAHSWCDVAFFGVLGLGISNGVLALGNRRAGAWRTCRWIAIGSVVANSLAAVGVNLLLVFGSEELRRPFFESPLEKLAVFVGWATLVVLIPAVLFRTLGQPAVRRWCGVEAADR